MMGFGFRIGIIVFAAVLNAALVSNAIAEDKFRVCADPKNPPYSDRDGNGFENKIAELFAGSLGQALEYTWFPQRMGFVRNTLNAKLPNQDRYKCDYIMGVPAGYDFTQTTQPYYHSTYALVYAKGRGWDDLAQPEDLAKISPDRKNKLRIAMFDRGPGTMWLLNNGLIENGVPYRTMGGDANVNVALTVDKDLKNGVIDMAILWGPVAGYVFTQNGDEAYGILPMQSKPALKFDFSIAMGIRYGDNARKKQLNRLINEHAAQIKEILKAYKIPLVSKPG